MTGRREGLLFGAFLVLGEVFLYHRMLWTGFRETAGDYVNHLLGNFVLEHVYLWLTGRPDHASFWDPPVFWPAKNVLAYAETMLGAAPFYWPWRFLGLPPDTAYQLWLMTLSLLTFAAAWLLFRGGFGFSPLPAAVGAFFCAFGKNLAAQVNNPQLHTLFYSYFALYCLCRLFREPEERRPAWVAGFFLALVGQFWACFYLGWLFVFLAGIAALAMLATASLRPRLIAVLRANLVPTLALAPVAALALFPLVSRSLAVVRDLGWSNETGLRPMLPHLLSWVYMGGRSVPYFWLNRTGIFNGLPGEPEERLGIGLLTAVCAAVGLWKGRENPWVRLAAILALALVILTTELPRRLLALVRRPRRGAGSPGAPYRGPCRRAPGGDRGARHGSFLRAPAPRPPGSRPGRGLHRRTGLHRVHLLQGGLPCRGGPHGRRRGPGLLRFLPRPPPDERPRNAPLGGPDRGQPGPARHRRAHRQRWVHALSAPGLR